MSAAAVVAVGGAAAAAAHVEVVAEEGGSTGSAGTSGGAVTPGPVTSPQGLTLQQASRFLSQATTGPTRGEIDAVFAGGINSWLASQFAMPRGRSLFDWLKTVSGSRWSGNFGGGTAHFLWDCAIWRQLITAPDQLRQRVSLPPLDIMVAAINGLPKRFSRFAMATSLPTK